MAVAEIAARQHGVVDFGSCSRLGSARVRSRSGCERAAAPASSRRLRRGASRRSASRGAGWRRCSPAATERSSAMRSAAALWGLLRPIDGPVDVSVPTPGRARRRRRASACIAAPSLAPSRATCDSSRAIGHPRDDAGPHDRRPARRSSRRISSGEPRGRRSCWVSASADGSTATGRAATSSADFLAPLPPARPSRARGQRPDRPLDRRLPLARPSASWSRPTAIDYHRGTRRLRGRPRARPRPARAAAIDVRPLHRRRRSRRANPAPGCWPTCRLTRSAPRS